MSEQFPDPSLLELHRTWTVFLKLNLDDWHVNSFRTVTSISTVREMFEFLNALPESLSGKVNVFIMESGYVPLWENHKDVFQNGGCWATVIKGCPWMECFQEITLAVLGESRFDDKIVKGICIVPVNSTQSIVKLWTQTWDAATGNGMSATFSGMRAAPPRFKAFRQ